MWPNVYFMAAEYGLIAVLFVILLYEIVVKLNKKIMKIEASLTNWNTFIRANAPLGVTNEQAKKLVEISFNRDLYEIMDYISTDLLFRTEEKEDISEDTLRDRLIAKMDNVLRDTRGFLGNFRTSKGSITKPLEKLLPLSEGLRGEEAGDRIFRKIADEMVTYLRDESMGHEDKLNKIKTEAKKRYEESKTMLVQWFEGSAA